MRRKQCRNFQNLTLFKLDNRGYKGFKGTVLNRARLKIKGHLKLRRQSLLFKWNNHFDAALHLTRTLYHCMFSIKRCITVINILYFQVICPNNIWRFIGTFYIFILLPPHKLFILQNSFFSHLICALKFSIKETEFLSQTLLF